MAGGIGLLLLDPERLCQPPHNPATTGGPQFRATITTEFITTELITIQQQPAQCRLYTTR